MKTDLGVTLIVYYESTLKERFIFLNVFHFKKNYIVSKLQRLYFWGVWEV